MLLTMPEPQPTLQEVILTSKRFSAADRLLLAKALLDSLVVADEEAVIQQTIDQDDMAEHEVVVRERQAYIALHPTLLKNYPNQYVAIHNGQLVDHDPSGLALSLRIRQQFPNQFVWIAPVKAQAIEEWVMRSPRFEPLNQRS